MLTLAVASACDVTASSGSQAIDNPRASVRGDVFTMSNSSTGNAIFRYARSANGTLQLAGTFPTGGNGSGTSLNGAGHTVAFADDGALLFASDAGSNDVAAFTISSTRMRLIGRFPSNGATPASIAISGRTLYVLNEGSNSISGFTIGSNGALHPISGSTQGLTGNSKDDPVDIIFRSGGSALFVPLKLANAIDTFSVRGGIAGKAIAQTSNGTEPFGSAPTTSGQILNTEGYGGASDASAVSSYALSSGGALSVVSGSVPNRQTFACWVALTHDERSAFVANTTSNTISSYSVADNGAVALTNAVAVTEPNGSAPSDIGVSRHDHFVYVLNEKSHTIAAFRILGHGSLANVQVVSGLPPSAVGLAAR